MTFLVPQFIFLILLTLPNLQCQDLISTHFLPTNHNFALNLLKIYTPEFSQLGDFTGLRHEDELLQLDLANRQVGVQTQKVSIEQIKPVATTPSGFDNLIAHIISLTFTAFLCFGVLILSVKTYRHHVVLLTLLHPVDAYVFKKPTPAVPSDPPPVDPTVSMSDVVVLFIAAIVIVTCFQLIRHALKKLIGERLRTFPITESTLYFVITDVNNSHVQCITTIYECVKQIHLHAMPAVIDISYTTHFVGNPTVYFQ